MSAALSKASNEMRERVDMINNTVCHRLREARIARKMSQGDMAEILGIAPTVLSNQENARTIMTVPFLVIAAELLKVPETRILGLTEALKLVKKEEGMQATPAPTEKDGDQALMEENEALKKENEALKLKILELSKQPSGNLDVLKVRAISSEIKTLKEKLKEVGEATSSLHWSLGSIDPF